MPNKRWVSSILLVAISCSPATRVAQPEDTATPPSVSQKNLRIAVTRGGEVRGGCRVREVARLVVDFLEAINEGDSEQTAYFFPAPATSLAEQAQAFQRYAVEDSFTGEHPDVVLRYLQERHRQRERLRPVSIQVKPPSSTLFGSSFADVVFVLERFALDLATQDGGLPYFGKGQVNCETKKVHVWAMGAQDNTLEIAARMCPRSRTGTLPKAAVVACRDGGDKLCAPLDGVRARPADFSCRSLRAPPPRGEHPTASLSSGGVEDARTLLECKGSFRRRIGFSPEDPLAG